MAALALSFVGRVIRLSASKLLLEPVTWDVVCCCAKCSYWMRNLLLQSLLPCLEFLSCPGLGQALRCWAECWHVTEGSVGTVMISALGQLSCLWPNCVWTPSVSRKQTGMAVARSHLPPNQGWRGVCIWAAVPGCPGRDVLGL